MIDSSPNLAVAKILAMPPIVTVIALCFNHERFVLDCLNSIRAQSHQNFQLIVTDDGSNDHSPELISDWLSKNYPAAKFIRHKKNVGICRTLNEALALAQGDYISMIATDDVWESDKIATQLTIFRTCGPDVAVVYSDASRIDENGERLPKDFIESHAPDCVRPSGNIFQELANRNFIPAMATLIRRHALESVGFYDERLAYEDYDMWLRLAQRYEFVYCPSLIARYRIVSTSIVRTTFTNPTPHYFYTVYLICMKWLPGSSLNNAQRALWSKRLLESAYGLYVANDPRAAGCLLRAAWYGRKPYVALLALAMSIGISRDLAKKITGQSS